MAKLAFYDYHNMVDILEKTEYNTDFHQIVDFLEASHIRYALTIHPTVYVSHIRQFWSTARVETMDRETKILTKVNGRQRTISEPPIRRHLKLNDEEELFASMLVPQDEGSEHPSEPHHTPSDQDEPIHHEQITQSPQHAQITSHEPITQFSQHEQTTSQEPTILSQSHYVITTPRRITRGTIRISQFKVPLPGADKTAFPTRDVIYGEAFPTITRLDVGQDRKTLLRPLLCPMNHHQGLLLLVVVRGMDHWEDLLVGDTVKDSDKSADKGSDSTDEMANVLGTLGAVNILASGGLRSVLSVATASTVVSPAVVTASGSFPIAVIFITASVATSTTRVTRSSRGVVIESSSPIFVNIPSISKKDKGKWKMIKPEQPKQVERDSEIAMTHAERELEMMIAKLDRSNEMVAKYLSKYEEAEVGLLHDEKVELIDELLMYQRHLAQIKKYQAQQNNPATKTKRRNFYMSILRSNAESERLERSRIQLDKESFKKLKTAKVLGTEPSQEQQSEEPKELSKEELKKMIELVPVEELYIKALQTCSTTKVTDEKAKELWVELKRLYEHNSKDPLWDLERYMHDPLVWRLYDTCGVHHISTGRGHEIFMLVEKDYPLTKGLTTLMLCNKLQVDQYLKMANELLIKIYIIANSPR
uniref:Xylulose kinase-1 n=1 Tax=Tanacetum cinerariifolium TaxID=118510 RepID=A0A699H7P4_TANCI|nr:hypothetical protein [Tanacetum cinerariifolium]